MTYTLIDLYRNLDERDDNVGKNKRPRRDPSPMKMEMREGPKSYRILLEAPGLSKEEIRISCQNGFLNVSTDHKQQDNKGEDEKGRVLFSERSPSGRLSRQIRLPKNIDTDHISARMENGLLDITIPKSEFSQTKFISIQ